MASPRKSVFAQDVLEIGNFEDLEHLVGLLNKAFKGAQYRLEPLPLQKGSYLFIEDFEDQDEYECGLVERMGKKVYGAPGVHRMIFGAYERYLEKLD